MSLGGGRYRYICTGSYSDVLDVQIDEYCTINLWSDGDMIWEYVVAYFK